MFESLEIPVLVDAYYRDMKFKEVIPGPKVMLEREHVPIRYGAGMGYSIRLKHARN